MAASDSIGQLSAENRTDTDAESEVIVVIQDNGDDDWWRSMGMGMSEGKEESGAKQSQSPKIRRVPRILREKKSSREARCYDPFVVSIGPYHHGQAELQEMESLKIPLAHHYVQYTKKSPKEVYGKVEKVANHARKCYPAEATSTFDDTKFTRMMFLDGCFILKFLISLSYGVPMKGLKTNNVAFVQRDLFLLENQLPYQVLQALMSLKFSETDQKIMINHFNNVIRGLRHLPLIERIVGKFNPKAKPVGIEQQIKLEKPIHLLDIFRSNFINKTVLMRSYTKDKARGWYSYPAAKELRARGVHFRSSREDHFTDIRFSTHLTAGVLTLPKIILDDTTMSILSNLVAYEACPDTPNDFGITSYVCFMDSLIDQAQDVEQLRKKRIIYNMLGSDHQAAELFNDVAKDLVPSSYAFVDVKERIENLYENKFKANIAEWFNSYFASHGTLIAFLAATFVILLTFWQTYLTWLDFCFGENRKHFWCPFRKS